MKRILTIIMLIGLAVGLASAQNTSKIKSNLTIEKSAPMLYLNGTSAGIDFYNGDVTLQQSSNTLTLGGGNFSLGTNSLLGTGSIGATGTRLLKGWFTDLEITNLPTVNGIAFKTALSLTATDVSLGNVTNESKTTMFTSPTFTTSVTLAAQTYVPSGGSINFNTSGGYLSYNATDDDLYILDMGVQLLTGTLGKELGPVSKGWFTDLDVNNAIAGSITGNAATVTGFTRNSGSLTLSGGHGLTITTTGTTSVTLPTSGTLTTNPMTTAGDIIIGGTAGAPTRLAATTNGYVLTLSSGAPVWAAAADASLETRVDSIVAVLKDTMNIETLLQVDLDADTLAARSWTRDYVASHGGSGSEADSVSLATVLQINFTADTLAKQSWVRDYVSTHGGGEGVTDSVSLAAIAPLLTDTKPWFVFGAGVGEAADSVAFAKGKRGFGSFNVVQDSLYVVSLDNILISANDSLRFNVYYGNRMTAIPVDSLFTGPQSCGDNQTTFTPNNERTIPPGNDVWVGLMADQPTGYRPKEWNLQLNGQIRRD